MVENIQNGFWDSFGQGELYEITCDYGGSASLAVNVANYFGLETTNEVGGNLSDIDIRHMDAISLIKLSLLEASASNIVAPYEIFVDYETNRLDFRQVGAYNGKVSHQYHTIQSASYIEKCSGVMVTGRDPLPYRKEDVEWKPIWGDIPENRRIFDTTDMISNCNRHKFYQQSVIAFRDPHLNTEYADGIDNLYEIRSPFEKIQGYAIQRDSKSVYMDSDVTIVDSVQSHIPVRIAVTEGGSYANLGNLYRPPTIESGEISIDCWTEIAEAPNVSNYGIPIPVPDQFRFTTKYGDLVDNFVDVVKIYMIGTELKECRGIAKDDESGTKESTEANTEIWTWADSGKDVIFGLQYGKHYVIGYDPAAGIKSPIAIFSNSSYDTDEAKYGSGGGSGVDFYVRPTCGYAKSLSSTKQRGTIFPFGDNTGVIVKEVWAILELSCPSVIITDPKGKANDIAINFTYNMMPLVLVDEPPPVAFNGTLIDQSLGKVDSDPTSTQDFQNTPYEEAMDLMDQGGGLNLHLSFLDATQCENLSRTIYEFMNRQNGFQTTYVCGPECEPVLGGYGPSNGIVNNIQYQYNDKGSYTISVTEGPAIIGGFASITTGTSIKQTESVSSNGTVIDDMGNGIYFKVRIDGFGEFVAFNISSDVVRIGDIVKCTIHNLPVED